MKFRPCIDIHNGKVKQIVGGSLRDDGMVSMTDAAGMGDTMPETDRPVAGISSAQENFVSDQDGAFFGEMYRDLDLPGGHIILLNPVGTEEYEKDIEQAKKGIVISSPRLNTQKVEHLITTIKDRQELGVKVTIITWHPDAYKYGRDDVRMNLLEKLRRAGFEIKLVDNSCEHFAVIDNEIVWYGSVNLLSKEDVEDNLMRVCSKEIAAELLERKLLFSKDL
jgi:phosphatidylserine/phosphatidylglycerophosphate/cardiolipin synthase-like enzyme